MDRISSKVVTDFDGQKKLATYNQTRGKVVIQTVRDEDEYMKHLGTIIQRDYFPDFSASSHRDPDISGKSTDSERLDELSKMDSHNPEKKDPCSLNLDQYLANNTTEDDASFAELIEEAEKNRRIKMSTFFPSLEAVAKSDETESKPLALTGGSRVHVGPHLTLSGNNPVHFNPDGVSHTHEEFLEHLSKERKIVSANTRFKRPAMPSLDRRYLNRKSVKSGHVGLDGKESPSTLATPQAAGFRFLDASPSPALSAYGASPLMTWGELDATPSRLDDYAATPAVISGAPAFRIPSPSKREQLAHKLADKASRQRVRDRNEAVKRVHSGMTSPTVRSLLSPAARRLLANTSSILSGGSSRPGTGASLSTLGSVHSPALKSPTPRRLLLMELGVVRRAPSSGLDSYTDRSPMPPKPSRPTSFSTDLNIPSAESTSEATKLDSVDANSAAPSITDNLLNLRAHS